MVRERTESKEDSRGRGCWMKTKAFKCPSSKGHDGGDIYPIAQPLASGQLRTDRIRLTWLSLRIVHGYRCTASVD